MIKIMLEQRTRNRINLPVDIWKKAMKIVGILLNDTAGRHPAVEPHKSSTLEGITLSFITALQVHTVQ